MVEAGRDSALEEINLVFGDRVTSSRTFFFLFSSERPFSFGHGGQLLFFLKIHLVFNFHLMLRKNSDLPQKGFNDSKNGLVINHLI